MTPANRSSVSLLSITSVAFQQLAFAALWLLEIKLLGLPAWLWRFPLTLVWVCSAAAPLIYIRPLTLQALIANVARRGWIYLGLAIAAFAIYLTSFDIDSLAQANYEFHR